MRLNSTPTGDALPSAISRIVSSQVPTSFDRIWDEIWDGAVESTRVVYEG
jgi:hypothetical protein